MIIKADLQTYFKAFIRLAKNLNKKERFTWSKIAGYSKLKRGRLEAILNRRSIFSFRSPKPYTKQEAKRVRELVKKKYTHSEISQILKCVPDRVRDVCKRFCIHSKVGTPKKIPDNELQLERKLIREGLSLRMIARKMSEILGKHFTYDMIRHRARSYNIPINTKRIDDNRTYWTIDEVEKLKELYNLGVTAVRIGGFVKRSRNSVISKIYDLISNGELNKRLIKKPVRNYLIKEELKRNE